MLLLKSLLLQKIVNKAEPKLKNYKLKLNSCRVTKCVSVYLSVRSKCNLKYTMIPILNCKILAWGIPGLIMSGRGRCYFRMLDWEERRGGEILRGECQGERGVIL